MSDRIKCMLDSNIFDKVVAQPDFVEPLIKCVDVYVTHVQPDEIDATPCSEKKESLKQALARLVQEDSQSRGASQISTESSVWGISRWGQCKWTKEDNLLDSIRGNIKPDKENPNRSKNKTRDALIAETAIENGLTLVTEDGRLKKRVRKLGGRLHILGGVTAALWNMTPSTSAPRSHNLACHQPGQSRRLRHVHTTRDQFLKSLRTSG